MPEKKIRFKDASGRVVEGVKVGVAESVERFSSITLEDGSVVNTKFTVVDAIRREEWDADGNPVYSLRKHDIVVTVSAPDNLKKPK